MPVISILPSAVADQIAAGEVVERPASVVKELVENAVDAGATTIEITLEDGGRRLIRVSDDGTGMTAEDVPLALARHGTSKIRQASDLVGVSTFGFRGEALPAIASVSNFEIETAAADGEGTSTKVTGSRIGMPERISRRRGTTVSVAQLFHNVPARLKRMRSARSGGSAVEALTALASPSRRRFHLTRRQKRAHSAAGRACALETRAPSGEVDTPKICSTSTTSTV
jgi:DNA mismatch repair protein MutL